MKCFIRANNIELSSSFRAQITKKILTTFARVEDKVRFVVVSFQDINGLRGGNDKQCKVKVIGEDCVDVHIIDVHGTPQAAFSKALRRAQLTFINRLKRITHRIRGKKQTRLESHLQLLCETN